MCVCVCVHGCEILYSAPDLRGERGRKHSLLPLGVVLTSWIVSVFACECVCVCVCVGVLCCVLFPGPCMQPTFRGYPSALWNLV